MSLTMGVDDGIPDDSLRRRCGRHACTRRPSRKNVNKKLLSVPVEKGREIYKINKLVMKKSISNGDLTCVHVKFYVSIFLFLRRIIVWSSLHTECDNRSAFSSFGDSLPDTYTCTFRSSSLAEGF